MGESTVLLVRIRHRTSKEKHSSDEGQGKGKGLQEKTSKIHDPQRGRGRLGAFRIRENDAGPGGRKQEKGRPQFRRGAKERALKGIQNKS